MENKGYSYIGAACCLLLTLLAGCASSPETPPDNNSAPTVDAIAESMGRIVIGAGSAGIILQATTTDIDGDNLTFEWDGPGAFGVPNHLAKSVAWNPPDTPGTVNVTCTATDPDGAGDTRSASFRLVTMITASDFGDSTGGHVTWAGNQGYLLRGAVVIPGSVDLTIEGGADIYCEAASKLTTIGGLSVTGGQVDVDFIGNNLSAQRGYWLGIYASGSHAPLVVDGLNVRSASVGLDLSTSVALGATIEDASFTNCTVGIDVYITNLTLVNGTFDTCDRSIELEGCFVQEMTGCTFEGTQVNCIRIQGSGNSGAIEGNSFSATATSFIVVSSSSSIEFHGNSFFGSGTVFALGAVGAVHAECNNWGIGANAGTIPERVDFGTGGNEFFFEPFIPDEACP